MSVHVKSLHRAKSTKELKSVASSPLESQGGRELPLSHVAIIMDGNRRWADNKRMPRLKGHQEGVKSLKRLVRHAGALGLNYLTVYAFSSENWQRSADEVRYLIDLFSRVLTEEFRELAENGVRLRFIGDLAKMPDGLRRSMDQAMEETRANTGLNLQVAINYGARQEITEAVRSIAKDIAGGRIKPEDIDESLVHSKLYTNEIPDPELLIRTGGEMRLSNYLLWQAAYTEIFVTPVLWPDFLPEHFDQAVAEFAGRNRRWGGD